MLAACAVVSALCVGCALALRRYCRQRAPRGLLALAVAPHVQRKGSDAPSPHPGLSVTDLSFFEATYGAVGPVVSPVASARDTSGWDDSRGIVWEEGSEEHMPLAPNASRGDAYASGEEPSDDSSVFANETLML